MEIDEPDQQLPQANIAGKKTSAKRRTGFSFSISRPAKPTRRTTKPYKMIPENWIPVNITFHAKD